MKHKRKKVKKKEEQKELYDRQKTTDKMVIVSLFSINSNF